MSSEQVYQARIDELERELAQAKELLRSEAVQRQKNEDVNAGLSDRFKKLASYHASRCCCD